MIRWIVGAAVAVLLTCGNAWAENPIVLPSGCGSASYTTGAQSPTQDTTGRGCVSGAAAPFAYKPQSGGGGLLRVTSIGNSSVAVVLAGAISHSITVCSVPGTVGNVWLNPADVNAGSGAAVNTGAIVPAGGCSAPLSPTGAISGISDSGTATIYSWGG